MCVLTAAGRGDIHQFHSFGINKKLKDLDIYMKQVSESVHVFIFVYSRGAH